MNKRLPAEVFPPGEFLAEELDARGWNQTDFAEILGRSPRVVNEIVQGKRGITPETARGLADALGTSPEYWLNLETAYQLRNLRPDDAVARRARVYERLPIKELIRRGWIEPSENIDVLETNALAFLGEQSLDERREPLAHAARKSGSYANVTPAQEAWLLRVRHIARSMVASKFTDELFSRALDKFRSLLHHEQEARHVPRILAESGIRFLIVEHLPHTKIDGVCLWLDDSPVVALSMRYDRIDGFWHTLLHELGHVKYRHGLETMAALDTELIGEGASRTDEHPPEEELADEFASDFLVPKPEMEDFVARVRPLYSKMKIAGFANRMRVHPGIVVGQLQYRGEIKYAHNREMLMKIRDVITGIALTDGWGHFIPATA